MAKSTIICVPGVWHVPAHFDSIRKELETAGYTVLGVDLPGTGGQKINNREPTIQDDVNAIRSTIMTELESNNVLLVTHSYSSIPGSAALTDLGPTARTSTGHKTSVTGLVIIAGFLCPPGISMLDIMGGKYYPQYLHEGSTTLPFNGPGAIHILYNDVDHNEAAKAIWKLKPQSHSVNLSPIPDQIPAMKGVPLSYLACRNDNAVPFEGQKGFVKGFTDAGVEVRNVQVAESGHSPFLKMLRETARFVRLAAGEEVETGFEELEH